MNKGNVTTQTQTTKRKKYLTIPSYAKACKVTPHAIYARLDKNDPDVLQLSTLEEAEGVFINTEIYPPKIFKRGPKPGSKKMINEQAKQPGEKLFTREEAIQQVVKETVEAGSLHNNDHKTFKKFMIEQHAKISEIISFPEFCKKVTDYKS